LILGIDTNVVVRLLVSDDTEQTRKVRELVDQAVSRVERVLGSLPVLVETEWVRRSRYGLGREAVLGVLRAALGARGLSFEDEPALEEALSPITRLAKAPRNLNTATLAAGFGDRLVGGCLFGLHMIA